MKCLRLQLRFTVKVGGRHAPTQSAIVISGPQESEKHCAKNHVVLHWNVELKRHVYVQMRVTRRCSWLRHCATSRKITDSIPDGVIAILHCSCLFLIQHLCIWSIKRNVGWSIHTGVKRRLRLEWVLPFKLIWLTLWPFRYDTSSLSPRRLRHCNLFV